METFTLDAGHKFNPFRKVAKNIGDFIFRGRVGSGTAGISDEVCWSVQKRQERRGTGGRDMPLLRVASEFLIAIWELNTIRCSS
jgi:hypothetical protein